MASRTQLQRKPVGTFVKTWRLRLPTSERHALHHVVHAQAALQGVEAPEFPPMHGGRAECFRV